MIKRLVISVLVLLLCSALPARAMPAGSEPTPPRPQTPRGVDALLPGDPGFPPPVELRYDPNAAPLVVEPPLPAARPGLQPASLSITVDYVASGDKNVMDDTCMDYPANAKAAFDAAANILQAYISSPVQIRIEACWANLGPNILGHSKATIYYRDFTNAPYAGIFYPVALANALYGSDLFPASDCTGNSLPASNCDDISIAYANGFGNIFYYGTDGNPGSKTDFESVVLHEMVHGLGFAGKLYAYQNQSSGPWYGSMTGANYPRIFDFFASNSAGVSLSNTATYPRPGTALGSVLVGQNGGVFFNGLNTRYANGGTGARLYTPSSWLAGSSYSHLDISYDGTPNALMTWSIGPGESIHDPGPVGLGVLKDAGWAPQPATGLTATLSGDQANLSWTNNGGGQTGFRIERSPNGVDTWTSRGTAGSSATSYNDSGLTAGDYYYRVVAYHELGDAFPSNVSSKVSVLATATALNATPVLSTQINLTWTNNAATATAATVLRSLTGADGSWTNLTTTAAPGSSAGAYSDTGPLTEGTRYYYQVIVTNTGNQSMPSAPANAITYLASPTNFAAVPASTTQINLTWTHNSAATTAYTVKRGSDGVNFPTTLTATAPTGGAPGSTASYNDTGPLTEGVRYYYQVIATNATPLSSLPAGPVNATAMLATPTGLATSAPPTFTQVSLSWTNHSNNQTGYDVYRADSAPASFVLKGHSATASYKDTSAVAGMQYYYTVRATNATGSSADSAQLAVITPQVAPTDFTAVRSEAQVNLSWTDNSANETSYTVERSLDGSTGWAPAGDALPVAGAGSAGTFTDNNSFELATQYYRICANNAATCSTYVESAVVAAGATLNAPQPVSSAPMVDPTMIKILWADNSALESGYQVQWATSPSGPWTDMVAATAPDVTAFDWVTDDGIYFVQARALNADPALNSPFTLAVKVIKSPNRAYLPVVIK